MSGQLFQLSSGRGSHCQEVLYEKDFFASRLAQLQETKEKGEVEDVDGLAQSFNGDQLSEEGCSPSLCWFPAAYCTSATF